MFSEQPHQSAVGAEIAAPESRYVGRYHKEEGKHGETEDQERIDARDVAEGFGHESVYLRIEGQVGYDDEEGHGLVEGEIRIRIEES